ncbi:copper chaperone PCu(A)C [Methylobacterium sp. Leaf118]|uniref:copper chaperone PCu(A)C n=1 Tax=Methylobacterium sp. Leaf118 TaxID=2876562 RepID=UPI001E607DA7|nr:DUF1775 domain-containing protein [Methylobacterium sp. Leaf118]
MPSLHPALRAGRALAAPSSVALALISGLPLAIPLAAPASAHALLERKEASPNAAYRGVVQIMHGCEGRPTTRVSVTIPEGVTGAKPMPKPGWTIATTRSAYAKSYPSFHGPVSEGVTTITWSGGSLPDDQVDEFTFFARISDAFEPGTTIHFPVEQDCQGNGQEGGQEGGQENDNGGGYRWSEIPAQGQDPRALKSPAPGVRIVAAKPAVAEAKPAATEAKPAAADAKPAVADANPAASAPAAAGPLAIEGPWLRATPGGAKVAGGYVTLRNTGTEPDRLIGAAIPQAGRGEIHSMSTENGVVKMAPVTGGLVLAPGGSVTLKPGGYHLMFLELKEGLRAGESVAGTLTFERAGTVPVTFSVAPIGATAPEAGGHAHHH